jgi:glycogen operon protein
VEKLRDRQVKNFFTLTLMSLGVPMILMGDEVRRTQRGNNNAYCHDNEISWLDWSLVEKHADLHRFVRLLIARRLLRDDEPERQRVSLSALIRNAKKAWHGVKFDQPDWGDHSHSVALTGEIERQDLHYHLILNAFWEPLDFELPRLENDRQWRRWIDTALCSPQDILSWESAPSVSGHVYRADSRSVVLLFA